MVNKAIPVNQPLLSKEAKENAIRAIRTGWISSSGSYVAEFETKFANYLGLNYGVAVSNGTAALHVALLALGIGPGDEVIVPAFTMAASWLAVMYTGATPIFVDCELETYNIDPNQIEGKITPNTKAIMPVHIYGHPADMTVIVQVAKKHKLYVIEDAAEAHGATINGKLCGSIGDVACFSFYANKILTTGEGGMVVTNNEEIADKARKIKDLHHSNTRFIHDGVGYNYRLPNVQAGLGLGELAHLDEYIAKKREMAARYTKGLSAIPGVITPHEQPNCRSVYWMYAIRIKEEAFGCTKDILRDKLKSEGIDTRDFFYPPGKQPVLHGSGNMDANFPNCEAISRTGLYLPSGLALTNRQLDRVVKSIAIIYAKNR